jgi:alkylhydroperoxidase family enzyme
VDQKIKDLAELAATAKIGCPWCMDFGYWVLRSHGIPHEKIEAVPQWRDSVLFDPLEAVHAVRRGDDRDAADRRR